MTRRLERDAPELYAQYLAGDIRLYRALVTAGIRQRKVTVEIHRPLSVARALRRHMTPPQLTELRRLLAITPSSEENPRP